MSSALTDRGSTWRWRRIRARILARDGYRCWHCGGIADQVDHLLPRSRGGGDEPSNLVAACQPCNLARRGGGRGSSDLGRHYVSGFPPRSKTSRDW
jgi:5-methylcytosine-specific restriction endonuclease McrA